MTVAEALLAFQNILDNPNSTLDDLSQIVNEIPVFDNTAPGAKGWLRCWQRRYCSVGLRGAKEVIFLMVLRYRTAKRVLTLNGYEKM